MLSQESSLLPLAVFLAILLLALLAWCILSSCMGRPILASMSDLWEMLVLSARSSGGAEHLRRRMGPASRSWEDEELLEMEYRGRSH
ncbi:hypothetical protein L227DRAFT_571143 [Lentinus tigrinus ALCF2SS1-6]|uniref:Uncharacterized protein n=1 Tax=Lentinus tigrinus ALCF2SS1-6 TaxID=1328759 RepID=A0A5C2SN33_9APHY|nr:hypothetical protein L227DRAFT_571143 [Lentinus tigrinus ALCF2SS1-6]